VEREPRLRRATAGDAEAIAEIQVETWRVAYAHAFSPEFLDNLSVDERRDLWARTLSAGTFDVFVAELGGRVMGFVSSGPAEDESAPGELFALYVEPTGWGKGAGRALLERAERALRDAGLDTAVLWVLEDNPRARRLYEAADWSTDGGRKRLPHGGVDALAVRYRKRLRL
jgi:ribosomal protein S18 acetylase RimI-like enzyme